jgi:AcrR family transcriptional regulator
MRAPVERQVRGERLIDKVLEATVEELSAKGYAALSIENVAERAAVAKTTIYRRWPTKAELVLAALHRLADDVGVVADPGSVRLYLIATLKAFRAFAMSPHGGSLMRMMLAEGASGDLATVARDIRKCKESSSHGVIAKAIKRGELPRGTDPALIMDTLLGVMQHYLFFVNDPPSDLTIERLVDLVLVGAESGGARPLKRAK